MTSTLHGRSPLFFSELLELASDSLLDAIQEGLVSLDTLPELLSTLRAEKESLEGK